ncbi:MAG: purine-binding chemotaxis protein CheW [Candidatus Krumholzibacteria bacterium]|nr:purine-binding chemotaxis protein CheW [Candidatus Krumholzibacteria bacterium]
MNIEDLTGKGDKGLQLVTFRLGEENYGIPVWKVKEIIRPMKAYPIPGMAKPVEGVINLRGEIIPVLMIHSVLGIPESVEQNDSRKKRIIILDSGDGGFGFVVDEVMDVAKVNPEDIKKSPEVNADRLCRDAMLGIVQVAGRMIICIDPGKLVAECLNVRELMSECGSVDMAAC